MVEQEYHDIPMPVPVYQYNCWNCGDEINDVICQHAGFDETGSKGFTCNSCGKDLGDYNRRFQTDEQRRQELESHQVWQL